MEITIIQEFILIIIFIICLYIIKIIINKIIIYKDILNHNKTTFNKLVIDDYFSFDKNIDMTKSVDEIVDTLYIIIEPFTVAHQENLKVKYTDYHVRSLKDGQLFNFSDDTIVYHYYNFKQTKK